jgi:hypothetical protein
LSNAYDVGLRDLAKKCAKELGYDKFFREGVYSMLTGPSYETVTECRFLLKCGVRRQNKPRDSVKPVKTKKLCVTRRNQETETSN